jgi:hypothetical protein
MVGGAGRGRLSVVGCWWGKVRVGKGEWERQEEGGLGRGGGGERGNEGGSERRGTGKGQKEELDGETKG